MPLALHGHFELHNPLGRDFVLVCGQALPWLWPNCSCLLHAAQARSTHVNCVCGYMPMQGVCGERVLLEI